MEDPVGIHGGISHSSWSITRWWFQTFFIFTPIWGRFPFWLIFLRWLETTNQIKYGKCQHSPQFSTPHFSSRGVFQAGWRWKWKSHRGLREGKQTMNFVKAVVFSDQSLICQAVQVVKPVFKVVVLKVGESLPPQKKAWNIMVLELFFTPPKVWHETWRWWVCKFGSSPFWWNLLNIRGFPSPRIAMERNGRSSTASEKKAGSVRIIPHH